MNFLKNIAYIFPVMFYYLVESLIIGLVISIVWKYLLFSTFNTTITYFQWVAIIWIVKVLFFDIFKLIGSGVGDLSNIGNEGNEVEN